MNRVEVVWCLNRQDNTGAKLYETYPHRLTAERAAAKKGRRSVVRYEIILDRLGNEVGRTVGVRFPLRWKE